MEHFINNLNIELKNQTDIFYAIALEAILDSMEYEYDSAILEYADDEIMQISLDGEELVLCYDFDSETGNIEFELLSQDEYEEEYGALEPDDLSDEDDTDEDDEDDGFLIYGVDVDKDGSMTMDGEYDYMDFTAYWNPEDESVFVLDEDNSDITEEMDEECLEEIQYYFDALEVYAYYEEENCRVIDARDVNMLIIARFYPEDGRLTVTKESTGEDITASVSEDTMDALKEEFEDWDNNDEEEDLP